MCGVSAKNVEITQIIVSRKINTSFSRRRILNSAIKQMIKKFLMKQFKTVFFLFTTRSTVTIFRMTTITIHENNWRYLVKKIISFCLKMSSNHKLFKFNSFDQQIFYSFHFLIFSILSTISKLVVELFLLQEKFSIFSIITFSLTLCYFFWIFRNK